MKKEFKVQCRYCGHTQTWTFIPDEEFETMDDIIEHEYEYLCNSCGCGVRVSEALSADKLEELGYD